MPLGGIGVVFYGALAILLVLALLAGAETRAAAAALVLLALTLALAADVALFGVQLIADARVLHAVPADLRGERAGARAGAADGATAGSWARRCCGPTAAWPSPAGGSRRWCSGRALVAAESALDQPRARTRIPACWARPRRLPRRAGPGRLRSSARRPAATSARFQEEARRGHRASTAGAGDPRRPPQNFDQYFAGRRPRASRAGAGARAEARGGRHSSGQAQAPVRVTEFSDFLLPVLQEHHLAGSQGYLPARPPGGCPCTFQESTARLRVQPERGHVESIRAPATWRAAGCLRTEAGPSQAVPRQGVLRSTLFGNPTKADVAAASPARRGSTRPPFSGLPSRRRGSRESIAAKIAQTKGGGVDATPTLFVNGKRLPRINDFTQTVRKENPEALGLPPLPASN